MVTFSVTSGVLIVPLVTLLVTPVPLELTRLLGYLERVELRSDTYPEPLKIGCFLARSRGSEL